MKVQQCLVCKARWFPSLLLCPRCRNAEFDYDTVTHVLVEEVTIVAATGHTIATVTADDNLVFIARIPPGTTAGTKLPLVDKPDRRGAYVPVDCPQETGNAHA